MEGVVGDPGCTELASPEGWSRDGDNMGEEKDKRYRAIKNSSLRAQTVKRTFCIG